MHRTEHSRVQSISFPTTYNSGTRNVSEPDTAISVSMNLKPAHYLLTQHQYCSPDMQSSMATSNKDVQSSATIEPRTMPPSLRRHKCSPKALYDYRNMHNQHKFRGLRAYVLKIAQHPSQYWEKAASTRTHMSCLKEWASTLHNYLNSYTLRCNS